MKTVDKLKEEIKVLQAQIEKIEDAPLQYGKLYFYLYSEGHAEDEIWANSKRDVDRLEMGNAFQTRQGALDEMRRIKIRVKLKAMANHWKPDWNDFLQPKYHVYYSYERKQFGAIRSFCSQRINETYFSSEQLALAAIDTMDDDLKFLIGVE